MKRPGSISRRAFRTVLSGMLSSLLVILLFAWWALEDLENTLIETDRAIELEHFEEYGEKDRYQKIQTAQMVSVFRPRKYAGESELPIVFQGVPVPYEGSVDLLGVEYMVLTHAFPEGDFYLAKSLRLFETREKQLVMYIQLLAFGLLLVSLVIAMVASRILSQPVVRLASAINDLRNGDMTGRLDEQFTDIELGEIAAAVNTGLDQLEESFTRERALISMASHELRTPVSVVLGGVSVMEKRGRLDADDARTLLRIKQASRDMSDNIHALLSLVRRIKQGSSAEIFQVVELLQAIRDDYELGSRFDLRRLVLKSNAGAAQLHDDRILVKMVLHNLITNALSHTRGQVFVRVFADHVEIADQGDAPRPEDTLDHPGGAVEPGSGLGLYIVNLACEQLGWLFEQDILADGLRVRLWFNRAGPKRVGQPPRFYAGT